MVEALKSFPLPFNVKVLLLETTWVKGESKTTYLFVVSKLVTVLSSPVSTILKISPTIEVALVIAFIVELLLKSYAPAELKVTPVIVSLAVKVPRKVIVSPLHVPKRTLFVYPAKVVPVNVPPKLYAVCPVPCTFFSAVALALLKVADNTPELFVDILLGVLNKFGKLTAVETVPAL